MVVFNNEAFEFIELSKEAGVTAEELAKKIGLPQGQASTWLSKWTRRGFLKYIPPEGPKERMGWRGRGRPKGNMGRYMLGDKQWASYRYGRLEDRMEMRDNVKKW